MIKHDWKLYKKSEYEYQIKNGRRIVDKIKKATNGWIVGGCILVEDSLEEAIRTALYLELEMRTAMGGKMIINLYDYDGNMLDFACTH